MDMPQNDERFKPHEASLRKENKKPSRSVLFFFWFVCLFVFQRTHELPLGQQLLNQLRSAGFEPGS